MPALALAALCLALAGCNDTIRRWFGGEEQAEERVEETEALRDMNNYNELVAQPSHQRDEFIHMAREDQDFLRFLENICREGVRGCNPGPGERDRCSRRSRMACDVSIRVNNCVNENGALTELVPELEAEAFVEKCDTLYSNHLRVSDYPNYPASHSMSIDSSRGEQMVNGVRNVYIRHRFESWGD